MAMRVGDRVADKEGNRGTVRYVGPVATSKSAEAVYVGIEWDDASRGKNDGSVTDEAGVVHRYFACRSAGAGSFLKEHLVQTGVEITTALEERYHDASGGDDGSTFEAGEGQTVAIQFVGDEKIREQQRLGRLRTAALVGARVGLVGASASSGAARLAECAPKLEDLDLRDNLLSDWASVALLGRSLPHLHTLNLGGNRMRGVRLDGAAEDVPGTTASLLRGALPRLRVLVLSSTGVSFRAVCALGSVLPALEELHVCDNALVSLSPHHGPLTTPLSVDADADAAGAPDEPSSSSPAAVSDAEAIASAFPRVHTLSLNNNAIRDWRQVWRLRGMPRLRRLALNQNPLDDAAYGPWSSAEQLERMAPERADLAPEDAVRARAEALWGGGRAAASDGKEDDEEGEEEGAARRGAAGGGGVGSGAGVLPFAELEALSLGETKIASWSAVDAVGVFPRLRWVRWQGSPVHESATEGPGRIRQNVIARMGAVGTLNHSEVRKRERVDAEKAYVARVISERGGSATAAFGTADLVGLARRVQGGEADVPEAAATAARQHPRFWALVLRHGYEEAPAAAAGPQATLAASVVAVTIRSMAGNSNTMDPLQRKLPATMTVQAVKQMAARAFRMDDVSLVRLSFREEATGFPLLLADDLKPLSFYGVSDGGEVRVWLGRDGCSGGCSGEALGRRADSRGGGGWTHGSRRGAWTRRSARTPTPRTGRLHQCARTSPPRRIGTLQQSLRIAHPASKRMQDPLSHPHLTRVMADGEISDEETSGRAGTKRPGPYVDEYGSDSDVDLGLEDMVQQARAEVARRVQPARGKVAATSVPQPAPKKRVKEEEAVVRAEVTPKRMDDAHADKHAAAAADVRDTVRNLKGLLPKFSDGVGEGEEDERVGRGGRGGAQGAGARAADPGPPPRAPEQADEKDGEDGGDHITVTVRFPDGETATVSIRPTRKVSKIIKYVAKAKGIASPSLYFGRKLLRPDSSLAEQGLRQDDVIVVRLGKAHA